MKKLINWCHRWIDRRLQARRNRLIAEFKRDSANATPEQLIELLASVPPQMRKCRLTEDAINHSGARMGGQGAIGENLLSTFGVHGYIPNTKKFIEAMNAASRANHSGVTLEFVGFWSPKVSPASTSPLVLVDLAIAAAISLDDNNALKAAVEKRQRYFEAYCAVHQT